MSAFQQSFTSPPLLVSALSKKVVLTIPNLYLLGIHKKDDFCSPIHSRTDWKLTWLTNAAETSKDWMALRKYGLSHKTFRAWILTLEGVALLAKNLIAKHGFHYVLLGKMQSDPLGMVWYVQAAKWCLLFRLCASNNVSRVKCSRL